MLVQTLSKRWGFHGSTKASRAVKQHVLYEATDECLIPGSREAVQMKILCLV
jgi:hypothetical protein